MLDPILKQACISEPARIFHCWTRDLVGRPWKSVGGTGKGGEAVDAAQDDGYSQQEADDGRLDIVADDDSNPDDDSHWFVDNYTDSGDEDCKT